MRGWTTLFESNPSLGRQIPYQQGNAYFRGKTKPYPEEEDNQDLEELGCGDNGER